MCSRLALVACVVVVVAAAGSGCPPKELGEFCEKDEDCESLSCATEICRVNECTADADCGGDVCQVTSDNDDPIASVCEPPGAPGDQCSYRDRVPGRAFVRSCGAGLTCETVDYFVFVVGICVDDVSPRLYDEPCDLGGAAPGCAAGLACVDVAPQDPASGACRFDVGEACGINDECASRNCVKSACAPPP